MTKSCDLLLGVDGGGTKTTAYLAAVSADNTEEILGRGYAGSSNIKAIGPEKAIANLRAAIEAAWSDAGRELRTAELAVFGLSGAGRPDTQALVSEWCMANGVARSSRVVHDALPVLMAGTPAGQGVALIAGTGAVAYALSDAEPATVVGGWGFWFGDEGSAFWLGQAVARAVSQAADGRGPRTQLTELVLSNLGIAEAREILSTLALKGDVRSALAEMAPLATHAAERSDPIALEIIATAAKHLAALVCTAAATSGLGSSFPLALAGGVITGSPLIRSSLLDEIAARGIAPPSVQIVNEPALGCVKLAAREALK